MKPKKHKNNENDKRAKGIKIVHEVTQEQMDAMTAKNKVKATPNT